MIDTNPTAEKRLTSDWKWWRWVKARTVFHLVDETDNNFAQISSPGLAEYRRARQLVEAAPRLLRALEEIAALPSGSQGGYGKFKQAQEIARKALKL